MVSGSGTVSVLVCRLAASMHLLRRLATYKVYPLQSHNIIIMTSFDINIWLQQSILTAQQIVSFYSFYEGLLLGNACIISAGYIFLELTSDAVKIWVRIN